MAIFFLHEQAHTRPGGREKACPPAIVTPKNYNKIGGTHQPNRSGVTRSVDGSYLDSFGRVQTPKSNTVPTVSQQTINGDGVACRCGRGQDMGQPNMGQPKSARVHTGCTPATSVTLATPRPSFGIRRAGAFLFDGCLMVV